MSGPMNLVYPTPGDTIDTWGVALNAALTLVEQHDHTSGKGSLIRSSALGINADVSWASFALTAAKTITFTEQAPASIVGYSSALFASSADHNLYYRNSSGTNVQITAGATLNVSIVGGIGGDYASVSALFSYDDATRRYLAQQEGSPRPWAGFATGDIDLYQKAASISNKVTLKSPNALAASYAWTFPAALPAAQALVQVSAAGVLTSTNVIASNQNITLQGTGYVQRGNQLRTIPVTPTQWIVAAGAVNNLGGASAGSAVTANTTAYYAIPLHAGERVQSIKTWTAAGLNAMTWSLVTADNIFGTFTAVPGASATNTGTNTLTPTTPAVLAAGNTLYLKIVTTTGTTTPVSIDITADVP